MISFDSVSRSYSDEVTIGPVTSDIPIGDVTALVGPNGAGKSTLLTMVGRLQKPDTGTITVAGKDAFKTPSGDVAKNCPSCVRRTTSSPA